MRTGCYRRWRSAWSFQKLEGRQRPFTPRT